jgi:hypothetical protein
VGEKSQSRKRSLVKKKYYRDKITEPQNGYYLLLDFSRMDTNPANHELNNMQTDKDCIITKGKIKSIKG